MSSDAAATDGGRMLSRAEPRSAEDAVTEALRDAIRRGLLRPGQRLTQAELAEQLGVSRIPLRDALRRLEVEGVVHIDGRKGAYVTSLDRDDVEEIYEFRILLEQACVRHAIKRMKDSDVERLVELSEEMDRHESDPLEGSSARRRFYRELYSIAKRPRMERMILHLRDNVDRYHIMTDRQHSHEAHEELRRCLRERDAARASEVIRSHLEEARDDLIADLDSTDGSR